MRHVLHTHRHRHNDFTGSLERIRPLMARQSWHACWLHRRRERNQGDGMNRLKVVPPIAEVPMHYNVRGEIIVKC
jgi:hypothetical protein